MKIILVAYNAYNEEEKFYLLMMQIGSINILIMGIAVNGQLRRPDPSSKFDPMLLIGYYAQSLK